MSGRSAPAMSGDFAPAMSGSNVTFGQSSRTNVTLAAKKRGEKRAAVGGGGSEV
jgi:hypothetical protein